MKPTLKIIAIVAVALIAATIGTHAAGIWDFKPVLTLQSNGLKTVPAIQMWEVRWNKYNQDGSGSVWKYPQLEAFTTEAAADTFAEALNTAYRIVRFWPHDTVLVSKAP